MLNEHPPLQRIQDPLFVENQLEVYVQRDDLIHPEISGNKWRKLKYNVVEAQKNGKGIVTFGGAYSNHIAATAKACQLLQIPCVGVIRGDELSKDSNSTLKEASDNGMKLKFISRTDYRLKSIPEELIDYHVVPEGGSNELGVKGCIEILSAEFDQVYLACGTGTTMAGVILSDKSRLVNGVPVLKGAAFIQEEVSRFSTWNDGKEKLLLDYHFGGYGKVTDELFEFIAYFKKQHDILLDPIYTGKAFYAFYDQVKSHQCKNSKVCLIHTGGLQGWYGFPDQLKQILEL